MRKLLKRLLGKPEATDPQNNVWVIRQGISVELDEVGAARMTGDLKRMMAALKIKTNPIDRHFLLMTIVQETYKQRKKEKMAATCAQVAKMHLAELPEMLGPLKKDLDGILPRITTFQHYATLLTEQGDYQRAIKVLSLIHI